jgi:hypothetical protein
MLTAPKNHSIYQGDYTTILGRTEMVVQFLFSIAIIPAPVLIDSPSEPRSHSAIRSRSEKRSARAVTQGTEFCTR